jgi:alkylation response protein AidB-like acyl-CoA dehydrogenase
VRRTLFEDEHELFRDSVRRFIAAEVAPRNEAWERAGIVDRDMFRSAGKHGFLGMGVPTGYGGGGVDDFRYNLVIGEEVSEPGSTPPGWAGRCTTTSACPTSCLSATRSSGPDGCRASAQGS